MPSAPNVRIVSGSISSSNRPTEAPAARLVVDERTVGQPEEAVVADAEHGHGGGRLPSTDPAQPGRRPRRGVIGAVLAGGRRHAHDPLPVVGRPRPSRRRRGTSRRRGGPRWTGWSRARPRWPGPCSSAHHPGAVAGEVASGPVAAAVDRAVGGRDAGAPVPVGAVAADEVARTVDRRCRRRCWRPPRCGPPRRRRPR